MSKNYLEFLELSCRKFQKKNKEILDIVVYGSFVKGKTNFRDIDLIIIFKDTNLKRRLQIAQELKFIIKKQIENIDIKTMNFEDFFNTHFFARQSLLIEGISLLKNKSLAELMGFNGFSIFSYNLKNLNHNQKTKFTYALSGRNSEGILKSLGGTSLGRGAIKIPIKYSNEFENFLSKWNISYKRENILESML